MTSNKRLLSVLLVLWGVPIALAIGIGAWVSYAGTISVNVDQRGPRGGHVHVNVPAVFVDMVLPFIPEVGSIDDSTDVRKWMPMIQSVCSDMEKIDDGVLVEVTGSEDNVLVAKKGRNVVVDVKSDDETVHIVMPIRTVSAVLSKCSTFHGRMRCRQISAGA